ncbi:MAG: D-hydroxyproline dehydrogenase subunit beta LhpB [Candidatus Acidiferrum sp.]
MGAACALELAREKFTVAIADANGIGLGATAAGMGHIVVMDDSAAQFRLTQFSQQLWRALAPQLPPDCEYRENGTLWLAADDQEMSEVHRKHREYSSHSVPVEVLDARALLQAEPHLRPSLAGALLVPRDAIVYPPCAAAYLCRQAQSFGAILHLGKRVVSASRGEARLSDGSVLSAKTIINATGELAPQLTPRIAIRPRKGHLVITDRYPALVRHQLVEIGYLKSAHSSDGDSVAFNVQPRPTGQLLIGSSRQYDSPDNRVESRTISRMLKRATEYIPALANVSAIRSWTGFRAATPDKLPLIGPYPDDPSLFLAAGHEGLGITTSLATARIIADQLLNRPSPIPVQPYLPSRQFADSAHA